MSSAVHTINHERTRAIISLMMVMILFNDIGHILIRSKIQNMYYYYQSDMTCIVDGRIRFNWNYIMYIIFSQKGHVIP